jgi:hypothetical protein
MTSENPYLLTHASYDGVMSALTGNGELCTTLGPTGFHTADLGEPDAAHATQRFVLAGRRLSGPQHPLLNMGAITRDLYLDGVLAWAEHWEQFIDWQRGVVCSTLVHDHVREEAISCVALHCNQFLACVRLHNSGNSEREAAFLVRYAFAYPDSILRTSANLEEGSLEYGVESHLGSVQLAAFTEDVGGGVNVRAQGGELLAEIRLRLAPGAETRIYIGLQFSDRMHYAFPMQPGEIPVSFERHREGWRRFWETSVLETGDRRLDDFRRSALYTIRCQATPWSVPPTISERYWGGGAFHDELYPFLGLLSAGHADLAERIPFFRLTTLPRAVLRGRGRGALYPWSSTEDGEERDPNGLWLTERFHMGQFALCIRHLWRYTGRRDLLEDLYPVLREIARYYASELIERDASGRLHTRPCVDFDESVGAVRDGPFTICAAAAALRIAAEAAEMLGLDADRAADWRALADGLWPAMPEACLPGSREAAFAIPDGKPFHYSVLGPIFPFELEVDTDRARATVRHAVAACRTAAGWQPGLSEVFHGSTWMWQAGHVAAALALQGEGSAAWAALQDGVDAAGSLLAPNEHVDRNGTIQVPWFTTGCGAWLYALHALFVQVDREGTRLFPAVPAETCNVHLRGFLADQGVRVSARMEEGRVVALTARAPAPRLWSYRIPARLVGADAVRGAVRALDNGWLEVTDVSVGTEEASLLRQAPLDRAGT